MVWWDQGIYYIKFMKVEMGKDILQKVIVISGIVESDSDFVEV